MGISLKYIIASSLGIMLACFVALRMLVASFFHGKKIFAGPKFRKRPQILSDGRYGKSGYLHLKNVTIHFVEAGDQSKPLLLLIHGFPEFWFSWRHQLVNEDLVKNFYVVAIDMRGYGDSDKPTEVDDYKIQLLTEDVKEIVHTLGRSSCYLAGHDWGGAVAWSVASRHPEVVRRLLILSTPHPQAFFGSLRSNRAQFLASWYMFLFQVPSFAEWMLTRGDCGAFADLKSLTKEELEAFKFTFGSREAMRCPIHYYRAAFRAVAADERAATLPKIQQPVMLIFGAKEKYIMESTARLSAKYCEDFRFKLLPNATHWLQQDEPDTVSRLMLDFILEEPQNELEEAGKKFASAASAAAAAASLAAANLAAASRDAGSRAAASIGSAASIESQDEEGDEQQQQQQQQQQQEEEKAEGGVGISVSIGGDSAGLSASLSG